MILRFSQKLGSRLKAGTLKPLPLDEAPVADWTSHLFFFDRTPYILVSNTAALYSTVLSAKGITNDSVFITRLTSTLRDFMEADGLAFAYDRFIMPRTGDIRFASAHSRSVTGSMNELITSAKVLLADEETSPFDLGFQLNANLWRRSETSSSVGSSRPTWTSPARPSDSIPRTTTTPRRPSSNAGWNFGNRPATCCSSSGRGSGAGMNSGVASRGDSAAKPPRPPFSAGPLAVSYEGFLPVFFSGQPRLRTHALHLQHHRRLAETVPKPGVARVLLRGGGGKAWQAAIATDNVLRPKAKRPADSRQAHPPPARSPASVAVKLVRDGSCREATQACLAGAVMDSPLLGDFLDLALRPLYRTYKTQLPRSAWDAYLEAVTAAIPTWPAGRPPPLGCGRACSQARGSGLPDRPQAAPPGRPHLAAVARPWPTAAPPAAMPSAAWRWPHDPSTRTNASISFYRRSRRRSSSRPTAWAMNSLPRLRVSRQRNCRPPTRSIPTGTDPQDPPWHPVGDVNLFDFWSSISAVGTCWNEASRWTASRAATSSSGTWKSSCSPTKSPRCSPRNPRRPNRSRAHARGRLGLAVHPGKRAAQWVTRIPATRRSSMFYPGSYDQTASGCSVRFATRTSKTTTTAAFRLVPPGVETMTVRDLFCAWRTPLCPGRPKSTTP